MATLEELESGLDLVLVVVVIGVIVYVLNEVANLGASTKDLLSGLIPKSSPLPAGAQSVGGYDAIGNDGKTYSCDTFGYCIPMICDDNGNCTKSGPAVLGTSVGISKPIQ